MRVRVLAMRGRHTALASLEPALRPEPRAVSLGPFSCVFYSASCFYAFQLLKDRKKTQKEFNMQTHVCTSCSSCLLFFLFLFSFFFSVCFWQFSSFTNRTRQGLPSLNYHESHQALPREGLPWGGHIKNPARPAATFCSPPTSQQTPGLPKHQPPLPSPCDVGTLTITFRLRTEPAMRTFFKVFSLLD